MVERYIFSGSLPEDANTYVTREADTQLYEGLKAGKFCYVLNSRQTGKSSLRVRIMRRLREEGFSCVAIDLSFGGIQYVTPEQWYVDLLDTLIDSLALDVDLEEWWENHKLLSPLKRFRKLIEEVLLVEVTDNIVIFIDEIDSVLSLNFPTDDFFAFIRACYNQRADNPEYKRLSFCLLGVASPSELIADKKRTPFNIGQAIFLKGFELEEVEPLKKGLQGKVDDPTAVMKEILEWTGGQPFLTQKLCQFVVEESDRDQPRSVEEIVRARIIANWESQDEPEHLKTIRDRILYRDEQRAGYLLELYQQIHQQGEIPLNDSLEQSELQLSGLVVKRQGKLVVTNPIYREVFNQNWLDEQLASLRPYSENFRAWVASGGEDESRLLRGKALVLAEEWAKNKSLSYQDREFLAAGRNLAIEEENKKAQLEREKKDKEAQLEREKKAREVAEAANQKAQQRIRLGSIVLILTLLGAGISTVWGSLKFQDAFKAQSEAKEAIQKQQKAEKQFQEVTAQLNKANKAVEEAKQSVKQAQEQETQAKKQTEKAKAQKQEAEKKAEQAQQALEQAKTERTSLEQEVKTLEKTTQEAERQAKEAQELVQKASQELEDAQQAKTKAENALKQTQDALAKTNEALSAVRDLTVLAGGLRKSGKVEASDEALRKAGLSTLINNEELKQTFLLAATAEAYGNEKREKAQETLKKLNLDSLNNNKSQLDPGILNQVRAFAYFQAGQFKDEKNYQYAYNALKASKFNPYNLNVETDILTEKDVGDIHYRLIKSRKIDINSSDEIAVSFREHLYDGLEFSLKKDRLQEADGRTVITMLYIAGRREEGYFTVESLQNFSCDALREIDKRWYDYPKRPQHFGFRVQKEIWIKNGSPGVLEFQKNWRKFYIEVGWKTKESGIETDEGYVNYSDLEGFRDVRASRKGNLPAFSEKIFENWRETYLLRERYVTYRGERVMHAGGEGIDFEVKLLSGLFQGI